MSRRLLPALCAVTVAAAACGGPEIVVRSEEPDEPTFFAQVVDVEGAVGSGLSLATDADGNPHTSYLAFEEATAGESPAPQDPLAPVVPAVMHAHLVQDIWTRGPVAEEQAVGEGDTTAIAVDADGLHHVAWTTESEVLYSSNADGEFSKPETVEVVNAAGISIAVGDDGTPWIAFYEELSGAEGPAALVRAATLGKQGWEVETAGEADPAEPLGTGVSVAGAEPLVAYGDAGGTQVARRGGARWVSETADPEGGLGVSIAADGEGTPHLAYLTQDGVVRTAQPSGSRWEVTDVAEGVTRSASSIAVDAEGISHVAWQTEDGLGYANNGGGTFAEEELPAPTSGGAQPKVGAGPTGVVYVAWYDQEDTELQMATRTDEPPLLAVPSPSAAPGGTTPTAQCQPEGTELSIVAQNISFNTDCLAAPAGEAFSIDFDNQDAQPHNVAVYDQAPTAGGQPLFQGEVFTGPGSQTYEVDPIKEEGQMYFQCDVHTQMNGTFVVAAAEGGGGGGGV